MPIPRPASIWRFAAFLLCPLLISIGRAEPAATEWADAHLEKLRKAGSCGVAALVARDGKVLWQGASGFADAEHKVPVTLDTKFRIGSVTKQFTAAAILKLAEEKKLTLDDPLSKFFPKFPGGGKITLRHLLTHTSGIHSYTSKPEFMQRVTKPTNPADLIAWFQNDPPDFAPGKGFLYNNSAYFLAGEIVASVSGKSLGDYLEQTFFAPLGMKDTGLFNNAVPPPRVARGFSWNQDRLEPAVDWDMSWAGGAGSLYSTVGDLVKWNDALFGGRVLNAASLKLQTTPNPLPAGVDGMNYGYGLVVAELKRLPMIGHGGGLNGWSSDLIYFPEQHCTVAVLVNALPTPPGLEPSALSHSLAERFLEADIKDRPGMTEDKSVDPKSYAAYVGRYDYKTGVLTVTSEDGHLFAQLTGQPKFEIFPKAPDDFFWKITDARIVFERDPAGNIIGGQHSQNGQTFKVPRLAAAEIKLSETKLDAIVGQYAYGPGAIMTVTRDADQVFAQLTGQPKLPIFAKSETEFEWRVLPASVRFVADADGKVTKAVHTQNGATFDAPKIK